LSQIRSVVFLLSVVFLSACGGGGSNSFEAEGCFLGLGPDCPSPPPPDTIPPTTPTGLVAIAFSSSRIDISWNISTDNHIVWGYNLYREGKFLTSTFELSATDTGLESTTQYCYTVAALDPAGNESAQSKEACATTQEDTIPPTAPGTPRVSSTSIADISLAWSTSNDDAWVKGYKVYRNGIFIQDVSTDYFTDNEVSQNTDYCYEFSAFDSAGNESTKSIQVCASTNWTPTVDILGSYVSGAGIYGPTSLALDSSGKAHITYTDSSTRELRYATNANGGWNSTVIDTDVYSPAGLAIDADDKVHISYSAFDGSYNVKYATNRSGYWTKTTVESVSGPVTTDLAIDISGNSHISYGKNYATNASGQWILETTDLSDFYGTYTSIALDSEGRAHIALVDKQRNGVRYTTNASGTWVSSTIDSSAETTFGTSISVDSMDKVHIAYYNASDRSLNYASNSSGVWLTNSIDESGTGLFPSLAVDTEDKVHISYNDWGYEGLRYANNSTGAWDTHVMLPRYVGFSSIVIDHDNRVHLSWYEANEIKYGIYTVQ
jgi:hypothetical protein